MDLNLTELTRILLSENHLMAFSDSAISTSNSNLTDLASDDRVLSSARPPHCKKISICSVNKITSRELYLILFDENSCFRESF